MHVCIGNLSFCHFHHTLYKLVAAAKTLLCGIYAKKLFSYILCFSNRVYIVDARALAKQSVA